MKCQNDQGNWRGCYSPTACRDWGYCLQHNLEAGGMKNVMAEMQRRWREEDNRPCR